METIVLGVEPRVIKKKNAEKLRKNGIVPGVIYHKGEETIAISVNELALRKLVHSAESHIIDLQFPDGKIKRSFIKDVQFHPVTDRIIHTDFQLFSAEEIIELEVPVAVSGESAGVEKGGKLLIILHALTIKGKPEDMPDHLVVDVTALEIGHSIHVKEIPLDAYTGLQIMDDPDTPVITVLASKKEAEATPEAAVATAS
ncbi:50S ribosomal protein L25/general stress protein Ctc [Pelodictyon phaeoclathratiforme]|jgi:large subunit ribosomal protein L25|uniref:Large ribosomal subunit protein bL25 n=1 Tax=Pelodictyon phaeoclathratiforme (strain DSM 5477 / BU-1) TaxID=324925 RepID=RL25_PELPB|nr:50S ribosomal protein L25/general stress protein Ctc [Pelodictyon phaeoclathratiforme]B4SAJ4.1 RecName: Full=Large ribosomal subunit protein bL25; AltName: Full=50S ribosomal protein L25; AltName: Full=General stress protein CTC [Pelodictyon phaeoclathratiforme BU-1]ACF43880.1 ribosomal 5S rRNA E-loop binding protein Ctc/L25/TL5 [Pelodictyon phaeoclathratiforme BU-1]MBV5288439.1 50S ribosomal protein L25/general stress protein Ctc [Pelodictyon phaeoclathratiforme]